MRVRGSQEGGKILEIDGLACARMEHFARANGARGYPHFAPWHSAIGQTGQCLLGDGVQGLAPPSRLHGQPRSFPNIEGLFGRGGSGGLEGGHFPTGDSDRRRVSFDNDTFLGNASAQ